MKRRIILGFSLIICSVFFMGCNNTIISKDEEAINFLIKNDSTKIGNASAVGGIIKSLAGNEYFKDMSLKTTDKPYGLVINYGINDGMNEGDYINYWDKEKVKEIIVKNMTFLFILIDNVDIITINIEAPIDINFTLDRGEIEEIYGVDLKNYRLNNSECDDLITTDKKEAIWSKLNS
ncbi:DUF4825 domain-containing protein [Clostridium paraputrificum]|uniref:DUF4825 domain-containing protein n=1 Tax=Clostridium paraputrificum TaxID=29363 RepID=UPI003D353757